MLLVESNKSENDTLISEDVDGRNDSTLLVNSTTASNVNPGHIRKLIHDPVKYKSTLSLTKKYAIKSEITLNGMTYSKVRKNGLYYLSKTILSSEHSLVDMRANGGVSGNGVRGIAKHPDSTVGIRGIDNHEIIAIKLVTAGGVTLTTAEEVVAIMH